MTSSYPSFVVLATFVLCVSGCPLATICITKGNRFAAWSNTHRRWPHLHGWQHRPCWSATVNSRACSTRHVDVHVYGRNRIAADASCDCMHH